MRCTLRYYKGVRRENYMCEFGIADLGRRSEGMWSEQAHSKGSGGSMPNTLSAVGTTKVV